MSKKFTPSFCKTLVVLCLAMLGCLVCFNIAQAEEPTLISTKLNGQESNVTFNASNGKDQPLTIDLTANQAVKFNTIAICSLAVTCTRSTAVKYFTQTDLSTTVSKSWDGKTGGSSPQVVADGEYKIVVTIASASGDSVSKEVSFHILILSSAVNNSDDQNSASSTQTTSTVTSSAVVGGGSYSAHSSQADLSNYEEVAPVIGAGRNRLSLIGTPVEFKVERGSGAKSGGFFVWSFGDGAKSEGERVSHIYNFPGEYQVVLNGNFGLSEAVARTKVVVENAKVQIVLADSKQALIKIKNNNQREINIGGWVVKGAKDFVVAPDTILAGNTETTISLPTDLWSATATGLTLLIPDGRVVSAWGASGATGLADLQKKLSALRQELAVARGRSPMITNEFDLANNDLPPAIGNPSSTKIVLQPKLGWWQKIFNRAGR